MSRPLRIDVPNAIQHVTARGNARELVFRDETDRRLWLETLGRTAGRFGWLVLAYCQMGNHFHLLVETPQPNLSRGMRQLNGVYAQRFNRRHGRVGHVFQARFHATMIERDEHMLAVSSYLPLNPVRAALCSDPADWRWSSYRATIGLDAPGLLALDRFLSFFGESRGTARARYRALVERHGANALAADLGRSIILGSDAFLETHSQPSAPSNEIPRLHWQPRRPALEQLLASANDGAISTAYRSYGYTMREIAAHLGVHYATVSRRIRRHERAMSDCKT